jgi:methanethiol S-methyltransferase
MMLSTHIILAVAWILYCVLHSVFASLRFKQAMRRLIGAYFKFYRLYYTLFAFLGFAALIYYLLILPSYRVFQTNNYTLIAGGIVSLFGASIVVICIWKYFFQLSGLRSLVEERKSNELMITGIHKYVRHPLYAGTFIFIWGLWILIPSLALLIANIIITVYTLIGIGFEEKKLENEFGEAYKKYRQQVPMIIPGFRHGNS